MSRLDSRAAARAAVEKRPQATTEAPIEDEPKTSESPEETPSGRDNSPETDGDDERNTTDAEDDGHGDSGDKSDPAPPEEPDQSETSGSGWHTPEYTDHPHRPELGDIRLTDDRRTHVLDSDAKGGGHRHGTGKPGKSEFPADWDDDTAVSHIVDVARQPDRVVELQPNGRWKLEGHRDGVDMIVIVQPDGQVWTAWPKPGGRGVVNNPRQEQ